MKSSHIQVVILMKKVILLIVLAALIALFPTSARAEYEEGQLVEQQVIAPLMAWVEAHTGVRVPSLPVVEANRSKLISIVSHMGRVQGRARALYIGGRVVLDHYYFDAEDSTQLSLLVHELVHYAQSLRPRSSWACPQEKEIEAYNLQNKWLEEHGHAPIVSASWINRVSACPASRTVVALAQTR
jgi:hypothetical protein